MDNATRVSNCLSPQSTMLHKLTTTFHRNGYATQARNHLLTKSTIPRKSATLSPQSIMLHKPATTFHTKQQCYTSEPSPFTLIYNATQVSPHLSPQLTMLCKFTTIKQPPFTTIDKVTQVSNHLPPQSTMLSQQPLFTPTNNATT